MRILSIILIGIVAGTSPALSDTLFPQRIQAFERDFEKLGEYRYVYRMFFKLYEAALFTTPGASAEDVLAAETAFHLQFRYLRKIEKDVILKSADRMLEKNLSLEDRLAIADRVDQINRAYTTVQEGDESSLTYKPEIGTTLNINGEPVITIEGQDFARLYFQIWLGKDAISESLKLNLLGKI